MKLATIHRGFEATDAALDLEWLLSHLTPRDRAVVRLRLSGATLREVGDELGISQERVRALECRATRILQFAARGRPVDACWWGSISISKAIGMLHQ